ncbi:hypothetical protein [Pseudoxanthomonas sacheonensis]|uniref:hypothetical protein n=1 Tax=Pseudoxanthomonas sacheonensis TaxID=443615 RepID=UPI0013D800EF|nr:hypothetical protein [Pseudoxanthomonas sacheonensis]KAF1708651.1 hypothetical protein CSC73_08125 [Pseudoxanthomonas sacheonensis]
MQKLLIALVMILAAGAATAAQPARPTVTIHGATLDQVKNGFTAWCLTHDMDIVEAESNRVVCTKPVPGGRGFLVRMLNGAGAAPLVQLEISFASTGEAVIATAKQRLETTSDTGVVSREEFKQPEVIAGTQSVLDEVAGTLKPPASAEALPTSPAN